MEILNSSYYQINRIYTPDMRLYHVVNLLTLNECDQLIEYINQDHRYKLTNESGKTTIFFPDFGYILKNINLTLHQILDIPETKGEVIQAQVYGPNQHIDPHYDFFDDSYLPDQLALSKSGQRTWTFIIYLNDVESGGQTHFIHPNIKIQPKAGTGIFWENLSEGKPNYQTLHAGLPIDTGKKYILTKWFREKEIKYI
jgi:prolyl 4-hydroxylase